jgi:hypothetical protein
MRSSRVGSLRSPVTSTSLFQPLLFLSADPWISEEMEPLLLLALVSLAALVAAVSVRIVCHPSNIPSGSAGPFRTGHEPKRESHQRTVK